jgi:hypothetical protein
MAIWYILGSFGIFLPVLVFCTKKKLATLEGERRAKPDGAKPVSVFLIVADEWWRSLDSKPEFRRDRGAVARVSFKVCLHET